MIWKSYNMKLKQLKLLYFWGKNFIAYALSHISLCLRKEVQKNSKTELSNGNQNLNTFISFFARRTFKNIEK